MARECCTMCINAQHYLFDSCSDSKIPKYEEQDLSKIGARKPE